jgi:hypothetical protein
MSSLGDVLDKLARGQRVQAGEREQAQTELARLDKVAARVHATDQGGASRSQTIRRLVVDGDLDVPTGTVRIGPVAASRGNIILASGGIKLRTNTTVKIDLQSDGDIFVGENTAAAATTYFSIFVNAQTYNSESVSAGDMLFGDNSSGKANIYWDKSAGEWLFRGGTATAVTIATTGAITAGSTKMDARGLSIKGSIGGSWGVTNSLKLVDGKTGTPNSIGEFAALYTETSLGSDVAATATVTISAGTENVATGILTLNAWEASGSIVFQADGNQVLVLDATLPTFAGSVKVTTGLNIGSATSAASGQVRAELLTPWNSGGAFGGLKSYSGTLADDGSVVLTGDNGFFFIREHTGNALAVVRAGYGTTPVVISSGFTINTTDTDGNWCLFHNATHYELKNRTSSSSSYTVQALIMS